VSEEKTEHVVKYFVMLTVLYSAYTNTSLANAARHETVLTLKKQNFPSANTTIAE